MRQYGTYVNKNLTGTWKNICYSKIMVLINIIKPLTFEPGAAHDNLKDKHRTHKIMER